MTGRMAGSSRFKQQADGSYVRTSGPVLTSSAGDEAVVDDGYDELTKAELEEKLEGYDLPKTGNKDDLIARLREYDASNA